MRLGIFVLALFLLHGCTALIVGGKSAGAYQTGKYERNPEVVASDSAITTEIRRRYVADSTVGRFNIGVRTHAGIVTLTGKVANHVARDQAGRIAKAITGVTTVNNQIVVEN